MKKNKLQKSAFSLIEVLIFVSILTVFFVVAAAVAAASLRNLQLSQHKILATRYMEELQEWLQTEKQLDFETFSSTKLSAGTFCYNTYDQYSNVLIGIAGACSPNDYSLGTPPIFKRQVVFTKLNPSNPTDPNIKVDVTVYWKEIGLTQQVTSSTVFGVLE